MLTKEKVSAAAQQLAEKKSVFDKVLVATPVLLTILATFLVSQSASEMTKAQYHRATASQNQSKVGDQWAFFQAKRIRGTSYEVTADVLAALREPAPFQQNMLSKTGDRLVSELRAAEKSCRALPDVPLKEKAAILLETTAQAIPGAAKTAAEIRSLVDSSAGESSAEDKGKLSPSKVKAALAALEGREPLGPPPAEPAVDSADAQRLKEVLTAIQRRRPEAEIEALALPLPETVLDEAIAQADKRAEKVARRGKDIENTLGEFDKLVDRELKPAHDFLAAYADFSADVSALDDPAAVTSTRSLDRHAQAIRQSADKLQLAYKSARHAFTARRYEDDARSNQDSAYLYEVKAYLSAARSDRHLTRSRHFMYAMLIAQAGVTIATLAMAVRQKSVMWGLATLAGLFAISFGAYVFLA